MADQVKRALATLNFIDLFIDSLIDRLIDWKGFMSRLFRLWYVDMQNRAMFSPCQDSSTYIETDIDMWTRP